MRISFLYSQPFSGHARAAEAIKTQIQKLDPAIEAPEIDWMTHLYPTLGPWVAKAYLEMIRKTPALWDYLYDNREVAEATREVRQFFHSLDAVKLKSLLQKTRPDAVVCTHALPCSTLAQEKHRDQGTYPLVGVITDFLPHLYWIHEGVDLYLSPNEESAKELLRKGIPARKIRTTGIPIDAAFQKNIPKESARKELGMHSKTTTFLVLGGSHGIGPMEETVAALRSLRHPHQTIVVTGKNEKLHGRLKKNSLFLFGHTRRMDLLMSASDFLIGKAGGLTCAEALAKGLPLILLHPLPGQEENNARYLLERNAAVRLDDPSELPSLLRSFLSQPRKLQELQEAARRLAKPDSAELASHFILELLRAPVHSAPS